MHRSIVLNLSDTHGGHKTGLLAPDVKLYDETPDGETVPWYPAQNAFQRYTWQLYTEKIIPKVADIAGDDPVYVNHLGDQIHGNKHPEQLISTRLADQIEIAVANWGPVFSGLPTLSGVRAVAGTGAHEYGEGSATLLITSALRSRYPAVDIMPLYHGLARIGGASIDYSHHGPGQSSRIWLEGNTARFYLRDIMLRSLRDGHMPPDLVLRGHIHTPISELVSIWSHNRMIESRIVVCPPLTGLSDYARQATRSIYEIIVGATVIEIVRGKIMPPIFITETIDVRTKEILPASV